MIYTIENEFLTVSVKTFGSELTSVKNKADGYEYLWQGDTSVWYGQSPILFPIIGRLYKDSYFFDGEEYSMPKHGLYRKRESVLTDKTDTTMTFMESFDDETLGKYPFKFNFFVTFALDGRSLRVTHKARNIDDKTMYFSFGAHPAFNCKIGDKLVFEKNETLRTEMIDGESYRIDETFPVLDDEREITITEHIFDNDALILSGIHSNTVTLEAMNGERPVEFELTGSPWLGIWAKPGAEYVCIEPWWGVNDRATVTDDLRHKDGIMSLEAGKSAQFEWSVRL